MFVYTLYTSVSYATSILSSHFHGYPNILLLLYQDLFLNIIFNLQENYLFAGININIYISHL